MHDTVWLMLSEYACQSARSQISTFSKAKCSLCATGPATSGFRRRSAYRPLPPHRSFVDDITHQRRANKPGTTCYRIFLISARLLWHRRHTADGHVAIDNFELTMIDQHHQHVCRASASSSCARVQSPVSFFGNCGC